MSDEQRVAAILQSWHARRARGEEIDVEEILRAHPDLADDLRPRFEAIEVFDRTGGLPAGTTERIGEFRILREIGRGGMGVVYEAEQTSMQRKVALKVLSPAITATSQAVKRFRREARAAGRLHHTNIVPIHAMGRHGGHWYYAMELVAGRPLSDVIADLGSASDDFTDGSGTGTRAYFVRVAETFAGVAEALQLAHDEGVVHRDIKPGNLLLDADGTLKIVDFGLARVEEAGPSMTLTGDLLGTPAYMSPEQAAAKRNEIDHRTDIYSLGATLYEVLTLHPPFRGATLAELCSQILSTDPVRPRRVDRRIPRDLETIVLRAMEKEPGKRYGSAASLARDLRRYADGLTIRARPVGPLGRTWRRLRRNKVRTALVASVVVLAIGGAVVLHFAARESSRRRALEYAQLCGRAEELLAPGTPTWIHQPEDARADARTLFGQAIEIDPERPEAYLGRALARLSPKHCMQDIELARERGLASRTYHLARAHAFELARRGQAADEERRLAEDLASTAPIDDYFEARLLAARDKTKDARRLLSRAFEAAEPWTAVRYLALRLRGELRRKDGDLPGAIADLHGVLVMGDRSVDLRVRIASIWHGLGNAEGERLFQAIVAEVKQNASASEWTQLCRSCRANDEAAWLDLVTKEALAAHGDDPDLLVERAQVMEAAGEPAKALDLAKRALTHAPNHHIGNEMKGAALLDLEKPAEAAVAYRAALKTSRRCRISLFNLGCALLRSGDNEGAADSFRRTLAVKPGDVDTLWLHGQALKNLKRYDDALKCYDEALAIDPEFAPALNDRGLLHMEQGRHKKALEDFDAALAVNAELAEAYHNRGMILLRTEKAEEARKSFESAIRIDREDVDSRRDLSVALSRLGKNQEALAVLREAVKIDPEFADAWWNLGCLLYELHDFAKALDAFDRYAVLSPEDPAAHNYRGGCRWAMHELVKAEEAFRAGVKLAPNYVLCRRNLGYLLKQTHQFEGAVDALLACVALEPRPADRFALASCLIDLLRFDEALTELDQLPRNKQTNAERAFALAWLGRELPELNSRHPSWLWALVARGRFEEALKIARDPYPVVFCLRAVGRHDDARKKASALLKRKFPHMPPTRRAYLLAVAGEPQRSLAILEEYKLPWNAFSMLDRARIHCVLGDKKAAIDWLERAVAAGLRWPANMTPDPEYALLLDDPRYVALRKRAQRE